jgi:prevent-host-death family protein
MKQVLEIASATEPLAKYVEQTERGPVVLTKKGRPVAVIVGLENTDMESVSLANNPEFLAIIERSRARQQREGGLSSEEVRHQLGLPPAKPQKRAPAINGRKSKKAKARSSDARR